MEEGNFEAHRVDNTASLEGTVVGPTTEVVVAEVGKAHGPQAQREGSSENEDQN